MARSSPRCICGMPKKSEKTSAQDSLAVPKKRGEKRLSNPVSTGGGGVTYETRVQAVYLFWMFAGVAPAIYPDGQVVELRFQGRIHGYRTDDLICTLRDATGASRKALLQVKLTLAAVASDRAFSDAIVAALYDYLDGTLFARGRDRLIVIYSRDADGSIHFATQLTNTARTSLTGSEFVRKATAEGFSSKQQRAAFSSIKTVIASEEVVEFGDDQLHDFLRHVWFVNHALSNDESPELASAFQLMQYILGDPWRANPRGVWSELVTACQRLNTEAASLSFGNLDAQISPLLAATLTKFRGSSLSKLSNVHRASAGMSATVSAAPKADDEVLVSFMPTTVLRSDPQVEEMGLSETRKDSANRVISAQLDAINEKLRKFRYQDALEDIEAFGVSLESFDAHQQARWYLQRGVCRWHLRSTQDAATDFLRAAKLFPDDEKMAAAGIRGSLLRDEVSAALVRGQAAVQRFPASLAVWGAYVNARIVNGEALTEADIPAELSGEADALQLVASARQNVEDWKGAVDLSLRSLDGAGAGFYTRNSALLNVLESAMTNKRLAIRRLADAETRAALSKVVAAFTPRRERLWSIQAPSTISETAANLSAACLILRDPNQVLAIAEEARAHGAETPQLLQVELEALHQSGRTDEMQTRGRQYLPRLTEDALLSLAQAAGNAGDVALVEAIQASAEGVVRERDDTLDILKAMRWMALWNAAQHEQVTTEALAADLSRTESLPLIIAGVRALLKSHQKLAAAALVRGEELLARDSTPENLMMFAEVMFDTKAFEKAANYYEALVEDDELGEARKRLLYCYIRTGNRRKARKLIEGFPSDWIEDDEARALAIELGQQVGDWAFLNTLAEVQFARAPNQVSSWLFMFMVAVRTSAASDLQELLARAPSELTGTVQQVSQLATQELRYGLFDKGMQRMYRMRRSTHTVESASAFMLVFVSVQTLPNMHEELSEVSDGVHVVLSDESNTEFHVTLDPRGVGHLPNSDEFFDPDGPEVRPIVGRQIGEAVDFRASFGIRRTLHVQKIQSAYRRLLELARAQMDRSLEPVPNAVSIAVPTAADGSSDFTGLHEHLKEQSRHIKQSLERYASSPLTLGGLSRLIGKDCIDIVRGWLTSPGMPQLFVAAGTPEERTKALAQLRDESAGYVVDAATLTELVTLESESSLKALPRVYATTTTRDILSAKLAEAELQRSTGNLFDQDGELRFVEFSASDKCRSVMQAEKALRVLNEACEVVPAYGPDKPSTALARLEGAVSEEEHAVLRLAAEKELCLLTIDGRLRNLAQLVPLSGVWPQALLLHARTVGRISEATYSMATVRSFLGNRSFVSLSPWDMLLMCQQGASWARFGISRLKQYLADPRTEFNSGLVLAIEFACLAAVSNTYVGAVGEILRHLTEALLRHPHCPNDVLGLLRTRLEDLLSNDNPYPPVKAVEDRTAKIQLDFLTDAVVGGARWSLKPIEERAVHLDVLFVGRIPWISLSKDASSDATEEGKA